MKVLIGNYKYGNYLERKRSFFKGSNFTSAHWQTSYENFKLNGMVYGVENAVDINWSHNDGIEAAITLFVSDDMVDQMNYVMVYKNDVTLPATKNNINMTTNPVPYFIVGYKYLRKDQYAFTLLRDVITENLDGMIYKADNKFLIKRELFPESSDLYYQKEDNFKIPMLKMQDNDLWTNDPHIVVFASKPSFKTEEGQENVVDTIFTVDSNEIVIGPAGSYESFISTYGNGSKTVYQPKTGTTKLATLYTRIGSLSDWENGVGTTPSINMTTKTSLGMVTTVTDNNKLMLHPLQATKYPPNTILKSANVPATTDGTWNNSDFTSYISNWVLVGAGGASVPTTGVYENADKSKQYTITVTPNTISLKKFDANIASSKSKSAKYLKYMKWLDLPEVVMSTSERYSYEQSSNLIWNEVLYTSYNIVIRENTVGYTGIINSMPNTAKLANSVIYTFPYNISTLQYFADVQNNRVATSVEQIYDAVILPFDPSGDWEKVGEIDDGDNKYDIKSNNFVFGEKKYTINIPSQNKVESIGQEYEIVTSDYTSRMLLPVFENRGFIGIGVKWQLLPNQVRYNILPDYKAYNGGEFNDDRGLWCEAIPIGLVSDAWVEFVRNNKNYLTTFETSIKKNQADYKDNMRMYDMNAISSVISGSASGALTGAMVGGGPGAMIGAVAGAGASMIDTIGSRYFMERQFNRNIEYERNLFSLSNATTKARPDQILRTIGLSLMDKMVPRLIMNMAPEKQFSKITDYFNRFGYTANYINNLKGYEGISVGEYPLKMQLLEKSQSWTLTNREFLTLDEELNQGFIYVKE